MALQNMLGRGLRTMLLAVCVLGLTGVSVQALAADGTGGAKEAGMTAEAGSMGQPVPGLIRVPAKGDLDTVWQRLLAALKKAGIRVHLVVDHGADTKAAGVDIGTQARLAVFGNPAVGGKVMQAAPEAAIDLPLKMLVWQGPQGVVISYNDPLYIAQRFGVDSRTEALKKMQGMLQKMAKAAAGH